MLEMLKKCTCMSRAHSAVAVLCFLIRCAYHFSRRHFHILLYMYINFHTSAGSRQRQWKNVAIIARLFDRLPFAHHMLSNFLLPAIKERTSRLLSASVSEKLKY